MLSLVFPGQGSQFVGMGRSLRDACLEARLVFEEVDEALQQSLSRLMWDGPAQDLSATENAQPALLAVSMAAFSALKKELGLRPEVHVGFFSGHSVGELCALCASGSLGLTETARVLRARGLAMRDACPDRAGGMVALLGIDLSSAQGLARESARATHLVCEVANDNAPGQVVLSGHAPAVAYAGEHARQYGARRAVFLDVTGPFHSSLMRPVEAALRNVLLGVDCRVPQAPLVQNITARPTRDPQVLKDGIVRQVARCVRWRESIRTILDRGVNFFVECGAGSVLTGLIRRIAQDWGGRPLGASVEAFPFGGQDDLRALSSSKFFRDWG